MNHHSAVLFFFVISSFIVYRKSMFLITNSTYANKMYSTLMKQNLHTVLHAAKKYSVQPGFAFYTLLLGKIFFESRLKKVCFLNRIKIACYPISFGQKQSSFSVFLIEI
jgi:hypothetical protein